MEMRILRLAFGLSVVCALAFFGLTLKVEAAEIDFPTVADLEPGDLFKTAASSTVYYFGEDERRYGFPNEKTYFTWYDNFKDVRTIAVSDMNLIPLGGMVTYKPQFGDNISTRLLKTVWSDAVYVPVGYGMLIAIKNEAAAEDLFGANWSLYVDDLPDAFVPHYLIAAGTISGTTEFTSDKGFSINDDKKLEATTGVMMYSNPLRFATSDESVCSKSYCAYNELTIEKGTTVKFVNYTGQDITVREKNNRWTTGKMESEDIVVLVIDDREGTYYFYADEDDNMMGELKIK